MHETDLLAGITLVWLFSAMSSLVSFHVILLNETHVALITAEGLLSCKTDRKSENDLANTLARKGEMNAEELTTVDLFVSL